jgi:hypothetical protein
MHADSEQLCPPGSPGEVVDLALEMAEARSAPWLVLASAVVEASGNTSQAGRGTGGARRRGLL